MLKAVYNHDIYLPPSKKPIVQTYSDPLLNLTSQMKRSKSYHKSVASQFKQPSRKEALLLLEMLFAAMHPVANSDTDYMFEARLTPELMDKLACFDAAREDMEECDPLEDQHDAEMQEYVE
jgi:hypothetical protein